MKLLGIYRMIFFNKIRDLSEGDIPQQQGVCLTEGFIADKGSEPFWGRVGIKIKDYKDVYAELTTGGVWRKVINLY